MAAIRTAPPRPGRQRGFNLLEILMTLFIITVGLLGLVGIQVFAQRAELDVNQIDELVLGSAETIGGAAVGAMLGARACIGFDTATQAYTVAIAWQGMSKTFSPATWSATVTPAIARNCAKDKYGDDTQRRVVWTTLILAKLT